jgi:hypothetical protein
MFTPIRRAFRGMFMGKIEQLVDLVKEYNHLLSKGGGGDGGALNRPRAAAYGQRAATPIAQAAQPGSATPSPGPSGTWQDCVQMPRRARWLSG